VAYERVKPTCKLCGLVFFCFLLFSFVSCCSVLCCAVLYYAVFPVLCFVFCHVMTRKWNMSLWSAVQVIVAGQPEYEDNRNYL